MIDEQGPVGRLPEDEAPTEIFGPIRTRERRTVKLTAVLAAAILIVLAVAGYEVATRLGHSSTPVASRPATVVASAPATTSAAATPSASPSVSPSAASPSAASPSASVTAPPQVLAPISAAPVGPGGAKGDDPAAADFVLRGGSATGWETDWYATPEFGGLQTGTGLLVDMGHPVTLASVRITLGSIPGADFELLAGNTAKMADMSRVAVQSDASGTVQLTLTNPAQARYLLVWFTKLPPDGAGHYMARIYRITITGHSS